MKFYLLAGSDTQFFYSLRIGGEKAFIDETVRESCFNLVGENRRLFMDNFYKSYKLSEYMPSAGTYICGTLQIEEEVLKI
jgi:Transposase IS4